MKVVELKVSVSVESDLESAYAIVNNLSVDVVSNSELVEVEDVEISNFYITKEC